MPSTPLTVPAVAAANTELYLGGDMSPAVFTTPLGRLGDIKFNGMSIDMVDVSNQSSKAHRQLGTLLKPGDLTFVLYWEPTSLQDAALLAIVLTAPPPLQAWKITWPDGQEWLFNGYLSKFPPDAGISKALVVNAQISIDDRIVVVP